MKPLLFHLTLVVTLVGFTLTACSDESPKKTESKTEKKSETKPSQDSKASKDSKVASSKTDTITLGAGCFWCIEAVIERIEGVVAVESGYINGKVPNPTYKQVCTGLTGHNEVVKVEYDPAKLPFDKLMDVFFTLHDPTTLNRQGADVGTQYRSGIYVYSDAQKAAAEKAKKRWNDAKTYSNPIVTEVVKAEKFYKAEGYHQDYFTNNPSQGYCRAVILPKLKKLNLLKKEVSAKK